MTLTAPPRTSPTKERVEAYENLRATSAHGTIHLNRMGTQVAHTTDYLQLANGRRVYHPTDLLPVLPPESPASVAARESESRLSTAQNWFIAMNAGVFGGLTAMILALTLGGEETPHQIDNYSYTTTSRDTPLVVGGLITAGVLSLGGMASLFVGLYNASLSNHEKATAFELYDKGLLDGLNLCRANDALTDCAGTSAPPAETAMR